MLIAPFNALGDVDYKIKKMYFYGIFMTTILLFVKIGVKVFGLIDFPLYNADIVIRYTPKLSQSSLIPH